MFGLGLGLALGGSSTASARTPIGYLGSMAVGGICSGWFPNSSIVQVAGAFTQWTDMSGVGNTLTAGVGTPTYNASSANITPAGPSVSLGGAASLKRALYKGGTVASQPRFVRVVCKVSSTGGYIADFQSYVGLFLAAGVPKIQDAQFGQTAWTASVNGGAVVSIWGYSDWATGTINRSVSVSNGAPQTGSSVTTNNSLVLDTFEIGAAGGLNFSTIEVFDILTANAMLSASQLAADDAYVLAAYGHH